MSRNHARLHWRARARLRRRALDRDDWRCVRCESPVDLEVHHVVPLDQGGPALDLANVETLCRDCHIDQHADPERRAWRQLLAEGRMTTIEHVYGRLRDLLTVDYPKVSSRPYKAAADPFTFDLQPRSDFDSWFIDPPATRSTGYIGDVESVQAQITIWLSREAGEDAGGVAVALAGDLARLRHLVIAADFDAGPVDVNVHESVETSVQPRAEGAVVVVGRLALSLDYDTDGEHP